MHLCGNVRQWIMHGLGGQPDIRFADSEFSAAGGMDAAQLTALIRGTVEEATAVLETLTADQLTRTYQIQGRTASEWKR